MELLRQNSRKKITDRTKANRKYKQGKKIYIPLYKRNEKISQPNESQNFQSR